MKKIFIVILVVLMFGLVACDDNSSTENVDNTPWFVVGENKIDIKLDANATTGYSWFYSISDESVLTCSSSEYTPSANPNNLCGVGGVWTATFEKIGDGDCTLVFTYMRSWEDGYASKLVLDVSVKDGIITATEKELTD